MVDFKKYKRLFAFGCSFTSYQYPTWANVVSKELDGCEFYNFGLSGAGNLCITSRISETHQKLKFDNNDLVMVMFTSFCREDRHVNGRWQCHGNVFNNQYYGDKFTRKYSDPKGYLIRDCSLIALTKSLLDNLDCDSVLMPSHGLDYEEFSFDESYFTDKDHYRFYLDRYNDVRDTYTKLFNEMPIPFWTYFKDKAFLGHRYFHHGFDEYHDDPHPDTFYYYEYLKHIGLPLTDKSFSYSIEARDKLRKCDTLDDILKAFKEEDLSRSRYNQILF